MLKAWRLWGVSVLACIYQAIASDGTVCTIWCFEGSLITSIDASEIAGYCDGYIDCELSILIIAIISSDNGQRKFRVEVIRTLSTGEKLLGWKWL